MKYIFLQGNTVKEIIPEIDPSIPDFPIEKRYPAEFIEKLMPVDDETEVYQNWVYDAETGEFSEPSVEEPEESEVE